MTRDPEPTPRRERRGLLWAGELGRAVLGFVIVATLARALTPDVLGTYLSITSLTFIVPRLLDCGLPHAFGYFLRVEPRAVHAGNLAMARHVAMAAPIAIGIGFAIGYFPFANGGVGDVARDHGAQLSVLILSELSVTLGLAIFIPVGRFVSYAVTVLASPVTLLTLIALWPKRNLSAGTVIDLLVASSLTGCAVMTTLAARSSRMPQRLPFPTASAYNYGIRSYGSALSKLLAQRFDRVFLVTVLGASGYAQYSVATSLRDMAILPANLYATTLRNQQIDLIARLRILSAGRSLLLRVSAVWLLLGCLGSVVMYPLWPYAVQLGFGAKLGGATEFIRVIAFSCAPLAIVGFAWNHLYAMQLPGRVTLLTFLSLAVAVPLFSLFISLRGPASGVAVAVVVWSAVTAAASFACALFSRLPERPVLP